MAKQFQTITRLGPFSKGERPEPLQVAFKDADGNAIDLTGYTVNFEIEAVDDTVAGLGAGTASLVSPATAGQVKYIWAAADFAAGGLFRGQFWIRSSDETTIMASEVYEWVVEANVASPY